MPGRQYTTQIAQRRPKEKRKGKKRFLSALSIAEQELPEKLSIRKNRLGELDCPGGKRRRDYSDVDAKEQYESSSAKRARRGERGQHGNGIEGGSDSEGNEWVTGYVDKNDDSSLDSDEAIGDSEKEYFDGFTFRGSSRNDPSKRYNNNGKGTTLNEGVDRDVNPDEIPDEIEQFDLDSNEESEGFAAEAVDVTSVLDQRDSESEVDGPTARHFLPVVNSNSTESIVDSEVDHNDLEGFQSDIDEDVQDLEKLGALQKLVSALNPVDDHNVSKDLLRDAQEATVPSEYGINPKLKLSITDLLPSVKLRKSYKFPTNDGTQSGPDHNARKLSVPLAKRQQDKVDRSIAFVKSKEALDHWIDTIKHNRRAEHLQFPLPDLDAASAKGTQNLQPTILSKPMNDLESTIQNILLESGMIPREGKSGKDKIQTYEELATSSMPIEEVRARRAEMRKTRALLFKEEIKAKRIKKIKSKAYRRVHRKQRERNVLQQREASTAAGIEFDEGESERIHRQRAEARMSTKHRNSTWAKAMKVTGRAAWDEDARAGMMDKVRREEELQKRIEGKLDENGPVGSDLDYSESITSDDEDDREFADRIRKKMDTIATEDEKPRGIAALKFMRTAEAARKAKNDKDIARLHKELAGEESSQEEEANGIEVPGRRSYGPVATTMIDGTAPRNRIERLEVNEYESEDRDHLDETEAEVGGYISKFAGGSTIYSGSSREIRKNGLSEQLVIRASHGFRADPDERAMESFKDSRTEVSRLPSQNTSSLDAVTITQTKFNAPESSSLENQTTSKSHSQKRKPKKKASTLLILSESDTDEASLEKRNAPSLRTNASLKQEAFASDAVTATTFFAKEKASLASDEQPKDTTPAALPGWGSWTGAGLSKREKKHSATQDRRFREYHHAMGASTKKEGIEKGKRLDVGRDKVIISEKRVPKNAKYLAGELPLGFETKGQYERSLRMPVGPEWSTKETFQGGTKPRVILQGGVISAMRKPVV